MANAAEEMFNKLAALMQQQTEETQKERQEAAAREARMQELLEKAITSKTEEPKTTKIPANATPAPMLSHGVSLREFTVWRQKLEDYMLLTGIHKAPNKEQKAVLRSLLDDEWFRIARFAIGIDMENEEEEIEEIIDQMQSYLRNQRNVVLDRKEFYMRNQQNDEKFDDYFISLQEIAGFCDFCTHCIDEQYRDRIVTGIQDEDTVKNLLAEKKLTLEIAVGICRANENASNDTEKLQGSSNIDRIAKYERQGRNSSQYSKAKYTNSQNKPQATSYQTRFQMQFLWRQLA